MDEKSAQELLVAVREQGEKQAEGWWDTLSGYAGDATGAVGDAIGGVTSSLSMSPADRAEVAKLRAAVPDQLAKNRQRQIVKAFLMAASGGAALRGGLGLSRMMSESAPVTARTVDMGVAYPTDDEEDDEKRAQDPEPDPTFLGQIANSLGIGAAQDPQATAESGATFYMPSLVLGTPLAAYAGWKGVDAILDSQRKAKTRNKLEKAKKRYEEAMLNSYKTASADPLDRAFDSLEKVANRGSVLNPNTWFPNMSGQLKGLLATYALLSGPAAYMYVDDKMKKTSKKSILEKAMKERARRQAVAQPAELYAVPHPKMRDDEGEKEKEKDDFLEGIV
jgi:hypothetical protein